MIANFQANAKEQIREIDTEGIGFEGDTLVVEEGIELTEKKLSRDTHSWSTTQRPSGSLAVDSFEAGEDRYVCQYPDGSYLPPEMIRMLEERGKKVTNRESIEHKETPLEVVEHASLFAEELQDYPMAPDTTILSQESRTFRLTWQRQCSNVQIPLPRHWSRSI